MVFEKQKGQKGTNLNIFIQLELDFWQYLKQPINLQSGPALLQVETKNGVADFGLDSLGWPSQILIN